MASRALRWLVVGKISGQRRTNQAPRVHRHKHTQYSLPGDVPAQTPMRAAASQHAELPAHSGPSSILHRPPAARALRCAAQQVLSLEGQPACLSTVCVLKGRPSHTAVEKSTPGRLHQHGIVRSVCQVIGREPFSSELFRDNNSRGFGLGS